MSDEAATDPTCAVCARRLLPGERAIRFVTGDGAEIDVCELCKPRAEAAGWLRPEEVVSAASSPARERRRPRGAQLFSGLLGGRRSDGAPTRDGQAASGDLQAAHASRLRTGPRRPREADGGDAPSSPSIERDGEPAPILDRSTSIADALGAFNHSDHRRTVAGLSRTLGPPRATALEIETGDGEPGVRLTIAWELTWYQWEVSPAQGRSGHDVRESGKGETIDQLRSADRAWNLMVDVDGTLQSRAATPASGDEA